MGSWNRLDYPKRLFLWLLAYSLLLAGCFAGFQYHREKQFKIDKLNAQLQLINAHLLEELADGSEAARGFTAQRHPFEELRISVIDTAGHVICDNTLDSLPRADHRSRKEIAQALRNGTGHAVRRHSESTGKTYFYAAMLGENGYIVRSAAPYSVSLADLLRADFGFLWIMGGATAAMCLAGYFATRRIGLHVLRLNRFAERAERGERICDTEPFPQDELGSISNHIVRLYADLQQTVSDRDKEHRAALYQQQEKERIKKRLTNNINHELKTPVAAIQACMETLLGHPEMSGEKRTEFLQRCMTGVNRLKRLLADVSLITRMDDAPASIVREPLDLAAVVAEAAAECETMAAGKGMKIANLVAGPLPMTGNPSLLASVFRNLIDNAIAYSGGTQTTIGPVRADAGRTVITVADNGVGVPPEHLPHLFERFYRIDKGRARAAGGTGLGLAIVKNAVLLHGGTIAVDNRPEGGLIFTITLNRTS